MRAMRAAVVPTRSCALRPSTALLRREAHSSGHGPRPVVLQILWLPNFLLHVAGDGVVLVRQPFGFHAFDRQSSTLPILVTSSNGRQLLLQATQVRLERIDKWSGPRHGRVSLGATRGRQDPCRPRSLTQGPRRGAVREGRMIDISPTSFCSSDSSAVNVQPFFHHSCSPSNHRTYAISVISPSPPVQPTSCGAGMGGRHGVTRILRSMRLGEIHASTSP